MKDRMNRCVRCTLFPSPMSEPCFGYFRDISSSARVRERKEREERRKRKRERNDACVRKYA